MATVLELCLSRLKFILSAQFLRLLLDQPESDYDEGQHDGQPDEKEQWQ